MKRTFQELMTGSGVKFGTSGARGLVAERTDLVCYAHTRGFLQYLECIGELNKEGEGVAVAGDSRPTTDRIMEAVLRAVEDAGYTPVNSDFFQPAVLAGLRLGVYEHSVSTPASSNTALDILLTSIAPKFRSPVAQS